MKKVVHLTSAHKRYDQRILWRECCSLQEHGYDVTLVVNDDQDNETLESGVRILSTGFVPKGRRQRMTEGVQRVYELGIAQNADIYHLHDAELLTIALKLKKRGMKVIFDSHEIYGELLKEKKWLPSGLCDVISNLYSLYETYVCKRIDGVICIGKYDEKEWFCNRSKRYIDVCNYPKLSEYINVTIPPYLERSGACYSGLICKERGLLTILEAINKSKTHLILAGNFDSKEFQEEFNEKDENHVSQYLGVLNRKEIFELYARCAIGICVLQDTGQTRKINNFNTKVYEYMAMEMPVILSDWPYKREMVEKYHFGLVANPNDAYDIAAKIIWLLEHSKEAEMMGKNGKKLLEEKFTWKQSERNLLKIYEEVIEE